MKHQNINNFQWVLGNFPKILEVIPLEADVVMGLSLIHHMFHHLSDSIFYWREL